MTTASKTEREVFTLNTFWIEERDEGACLRELLKWWQVNKETRQLKQLQLEWCYPNEQSSFCRMQVFYEG